MTADKTGAAGDYTSLRRGGTNPLLTNVPASSLHVIAGYAGPLPGRSLVVVFANLRFTRRHWSGICRISGLYRVEPGESPLGYLQ